MKAMTEAERSIAVKRKVAVTKPMSRDDSPSDVYSPKRKRSDDSREEASPPPYIPSRKDSIDRRIQRSSATHRNEQRQLSRDDVRHTLSQEDRRELISRSRREELLRTIGIDRERHRVDSSDTYERGRRHSEGEKNVTFEREVKSDRNIGGVKNFQITALVSSETTTNSSKKPGSLSPEPRRSLQVKSTSPSQSESKSWFTSRLGKVIVERREVVKRKDAREDINARIALSKSKSEQRETKPLQAKTSENMSRKVGARVLSRIGKEAVQKQCEAAVLSVQASQLNERPKVTVSPDSRVVRCDTDSHSDDEGQGSRDKERVRVKIPPQMKDISDKVVKGRAHDSGDEDETEDLAKMIDDDLEPELLDGTHNDEFTLDLDDDDISHVVGDIEEEAAAEDDLQESEKAPESKLGTRFIVTLDGVDERQFESDVMFEKFRRPMLGSTPVPVASVAASISDDVQQDPKLFLDLLAAQGRPFTQTVLQHTQALTPIQVVPSKITPPKIQPFSISLKDSDDEHDDKDIKAVARTHPLYQGQADEVESGISSVKRAKMSERCKYWPACVAGSACEYHHPTTHCKTFPNCKYGDKCLFIHPNCRFDSKCARPDCPYTHTSRRPNLSAAANFITIPQPHLLFSTAPPKSYYGSNIASSYPSNQTVCRYFPNCHNMNCPFVHPKPCRFGVACKSTGCPFYHPPVPGKNKLKWQAQVSQNKGPALELPGPGKPNPVEMKAAHSFSANVSHSTTVSSTSQ